MDTDRKTLIADAALHLLGMGGAKGLTHRAVDAQAGLPNGSTSFYCRTRLELLKLAVERHAALDMADLKADGRQWSAKDASLEGFLQTVATRVVAWAQADRRAHLRARFELILISAAEPELACTLHQLRQGFVVATVAALKRAGVDAPQRRAAWVVMAVDGLLMSTLNEPDQSLDRQACLDMLRALMR
ncbi:TetR family transcriptional regulator [Aquabacterium lacunae]|uniref:TetR family transcriptional regulator n=1 Tax=Aquabacterium lacunae TaxID=2528630 RepID=A0A4Q9H3X1_9BURK|nr:TetR/AcrR family transcriptional regulator [Aquabacterium lacunae]TBO31166.1 TetR family transcriptional regulator [Aquabacterium lacunae]